MHQFLEVWWKIQSRMGKRTSWNPNKEHAQRTSTLLEEISLGPWCDGLFLMTLRDVSTPLYVQWLENRIIDIFLFSRFFKIRSPFPKFFWEPQPRHYQLNVCRRRKLNTQAFGSRVEFIGHRYRVWRQYSPILYTRLGRLPGRCWRRRRRRQLPRHIPRGKLRLWHGSFSFLRNISSLCWMSSTLSFKVGERSEKNAYLITVSEWHFCSDRFLRFPPFSRFFGYLRYSDHLFEQIHDRLAGGRSTF